MEEDPKPKFFVPPKAPGNDERITEVIRMTPSWYPRRQALEDRMPRHLPGLTEVGQA